MSGIVLSVLFTSIHLISSALLGYRFIIPTLQPRKIRLSKDKSLSQVNKISG